MSPRSRTEGAEMASEPADTRREAVFRHLAGSQLARAYRLAGFVLGDQADAEDATHDAFVRAWQALPTLRDMAGARAWFDRILVNVCRDRLRRSRRIRFIPVDDPVGIVATLQGGDPFRAVLERDEALRALAVLDPDERIVVVLHYFGDLTIAEVAHRLGVPEGTAKSRLSRALRRMERALADSPKEVSRV